MVISDSENFIFVHNPKCAGTSLRRALSIVDTRNDFYWMFHKLKGPFPDRDIKIDKAHMPLFMIERLFPDDYKLFFSYTTLIIVRHPIIRLVSAFNESIKNENGLTQAEIRNAFEKYVEVRISSGPLNFHTRHALRQCDMIFNNNKKIIDHIVKIEEPKAGLAELFISRPRIAKILDKSLNSALNITVNRECFIPKNNVKKYINNLPSELLDGLYSYYEADFSSLCYDRFEY